MIVPYTLTLQSRLTEQVLLESFIEEVCEYYNIGNTYFGHILLSLTEAFHNAVIHGNNNDPLKNVIIELCNTRRGLLFSVIDEGAGFNPEGIPDPTNPDNVGDNIMGRGLFTIRSLADEVQFGKNGKVIYISFFVSSMNLELSEMRAKELSNYLNPVSIKTKKEL